VQGPQRVIHCGNRLLFFPWRLSVFSEIFVFLQRIKFPPVLSNCGLLATVCWYGSSSSGRGTFASFRARPLALFLELVFRPKDLFSIPVLLRVSADQCRGRHSSTKRGRQSSPVTRQPLTRPSSYVFWRHPLFAQRDGVCNKNNLKASPLRSGIPYPSKFVLGDAPPFFSCFLRP